MIMSALYKPAFRKFVKKQNRAFQLAIEDEVYAVLESPQAGELKKGDLEGVRVHKFKFRKQEYLVAYVIRQKDIIFYMIGVHENFYKELKSYLKEVE
jgi:mRNA-degrading endonuclease RelE of RelBE toxin-antitoxin system